MHSLFCFNLQFADAVVYSMPGYDIDVRDWCYMCLMGGEL